MPDSIENNVLTVRSSHASGEFLRTLGKIRDDGLFLDIVLGSYFETHSTTCIANLIQPTTDCIFYSRYTLKCILPSKRLRDTCASGQRGLGDGIHATSRR